MLWFPRCLEPSSPFQTAVHSGMHQLQESVHISVELSLLAPGGKDTYAQVLRQAGHAVPFLPAPTSRSRREPAGDSAKINRLGAAHCSLADVGCDHGTIQSRPEKRSLLHLSRR